MHSLQGKLRVHICASQSSLLGCKLVLFVVDKLLGDVKAGENVVVEVLVERQFALIGHLLIKRIYRVHKRCQPFYPKQALVAVGNYAEGNGMNVIVAVCVKLRFSYAAVYYIVFADCVCHSFSVLFGQVIVSYSLGGQVLAHRVAVKACGIPSHLEEVFHARLARLYVSDI